MPEAKRKKSEHARRMDKLRAALRRKRLDALIVFDRYNTFYLTGFQCTHSYLLVTPEGARFLVDGRYIEAAREKVAHCEVELFDKIAPALRKWQKEIQPRRIGLEGSVAWNVWREFKQLIDGVEWIEAGELIGKMRLIKSREEIKKIQAAARLTDEIYEAVLDEAVAGVSEVDLRNVIRAEADKRGADGLSFDCIVASGPATSMPHYNPQPEYLHRGDLLLIDLGVRLNGYCSDMTRVVALGEAPKKKLRDVYDAVLEAEQTCIEAVKPGVKCADLHRLAVDTLKKHRLARYFTHGLGHGVGLEIHEPPRLNGTSTEMLRAGMAITIEPGVYLPGVGGVRIEDLVVVTRSGCRVLSKAPREFRKNPFD